MNLLKNSEEQKALDSYKKYAERGMDLMFPVSIAGQTHRPDIKMPYHTTIKLFDPSKDSHEKVHEVAQKLKLHPPRPEEVHIEPATLRGRDGYIMHVIRLHGPHAENIKEHNKQFSNMGYQQNYEFHPHITVDKDTWDKIVANKYRTAKEAGIEFKPASLMQGHKELATYKHMDKMEKGIKQVAATLGLVGALAGSPAQAKEKSPYSRQKMLNTIATVETQGGKFTEHKPVGGLHHGEKAYGKYALMPTIIRETVRRHRPLREKHSKVMQLQGQDLHNYMQDNPDLEEVVADRHLKRLEHHFGQDPERLGFAWNQGILGTYRALREKKDIGNHWHVLKIKNAYKEGK